MMIAGIDEAGRGCVIGPLVVAGLSVKKENLPALLDIGVKDSKLLTPKKRESLAPKIIKIAVKHVSIQVSPQEIDQVVQSNRRLHKLNRLEAKTMGEIIAALEPDLAYVDAADVVEERFGHHVSESSSFKTKIVSKHKADRTYPVVSAASILAKVERDQAVSELRNQLGDFGTGYLTDPKTDQFLREWLRTHEDFPDCVRKSWKPAKLAKSQRGTEQQRLV